MHASCIRDERGMAFFFRRGKPNRRVNSPYLLLEVVLTVVFALGVRSLYYSRFSVLFFWCGYLSISCITVLNITSSSSINKKLLSIVLYSFSLHLIIPLVQPVGVVWNPDAVFTTQAARLIMEQKTWIPGAGTGAARTHYSNFPPLPLLEVYLSYITSIDVSLVQQYLMLIYSPLFLTGVFFFMRKVTGSSDMAILSAFFFATNPIFEYFSGYTAYQGLAYVFVAFILVSLCGIQRRWAYLFLVFSIALAFTHHWSSYNLILFLVLVAVFFHLSKWRSVRFNMRIRRLSVLFIIVIVASWLVFIAAFTLTEQADTLRELMESLANLHTAIVGELTYSFGPKGLPIERFFNYLGLATFVTFGAYGSFISLKERRRLEAYLFIFGTGISFLNYFVFPWHLFLTSSGGRVRILDYAYFYLVPAAVVGALQLRGLLSKRSTKGIYVFAVLILLLTPSTVITMYHRFYYTAHTPYELKGLNPNVATLEWMATARWVGLFAPPKIPILGGIMAWMYVGATAMREVDFVQLPNFLNQLASGNSEPEETWRIVVIDNAMLRLGGDLFFDFAAENYNMAEAHLNLVYDNGAIKLFIHPAIEADR